MKRNRHRRSQRTRAIPRTPGAEKDYVVIIQCHIAKERCSGYFCEKAFHDRTGGFAAYARDKPYRVLSMTCGGCCGKSVHRRLTHLVRKLKKYDGMDKGQVVVHLASCMTKDNFHSPRCLFVDYIRELVARVGLACREDTHISPAAEAHRAAGLYRKRRKRSTHT